MKQFHELSPEQQDKAVSFAKTELERSVLARVIVFHHKTQKDDIVKYSKEAAEGSTYSDSGNPIVEGRERIL